MKVIFELRKEKATANGLIPIQFVVRAEGGKTGQIDHHFPV